MSNRYKGGIISATPPTTTGGDDGVASGSWTLEQQLQAQAAGNWPSQPVFYIENVFSTWLYTGNGATQTITNGINLSGKGGMVWVKSRSTATDNTLYDTVRGPSNFVFSNGTSGNQSPSELTSFNSNGFSLSYDSLIQETNNSGTTYASWTFREQPKFFDVVTWTGNSTANRPIAHNLGSSPGCILVKQTNTARAWAVFHRSLGGGGTTQNLVLNTTAAAANNAYFPAVSATEFQVSASSAVNESGGTYVAYLFAHNAGGFGLTGTDNVISCGSFTTSSFTATVNLGYEPQWLLAKRTDSTGNWLMYDTMRGWINSSSSYGQLLLANTSGAETNNARGEPNATGFRFEDTIAAGTYIYIAIRRGPMATPTTGTSVFDVGTRTGSASVAKTSSNVLTDLTFIKNRNNGGEYWAWTPRLVGNQTLQSNSSDAELAGAMATNPWDTMTGAFCAASNGATNSGNLIDYSFRRAPGFHDVVCATTDGSGVFTGAHNLGVAPELIITKPRNAVDSWWVYAGSVNRYLLLDSTAAEVTSTGVWGTAPTSTTFTMINGVGVATQVAYLFASCPGVSKVGTYTGTGTTQTINCGFTAGARFVLIKRTDSTGDWYVWDSARGIVAGNDPYLLLNSTAAEVTNTDFVDTAATGFEISSTAPAAINANGGTFIFLAIA